MIVPIVVVAYNRARSLQRLLDSLANAVYDNKDVPLIISIDRGDNQDVLNVAEKFNWEHGTKKVVYQLENLKLRKHVLKCGDYANEFGSVIVLEDDLLVSKYFYKYAVRALEFSKNDERVGGISLYNHRYNVEASEPFECHDDNYDNWYFQFASSWGEAWTKEQWQSFREWYDNTLAIDDKCDVPEYVRNWSDSSWLKYFICYLVEKNKFFLYPKKSLTTNFGEAGTHVDKSNTNFQVPLQNGNIEYVFSTLDQSDSIYDAFFENKRVNDILSLEGMDVTVDLYGMKDIKLVNSRYFLSRKALPYKVIKSFGCFMRPHEDNIFYGINGNDFFLYDLFINGKKPKVNMIRKTQYNLRYIDRKQYLSVLKMFCEKTKDGIMRRAKKLHNK
ncbi:glycosyltransferase [Butyrivibrio proteoclasticus]|uniref:glycosyltransferase n=1 Tax=Butyrivibrio proteoclasticus TaxID=43305 RepID=UPI000684DFB2|nr:glycosyltransferase [Butyrivibrio proteoclasticus]